MGDAGEVFSSLADAMGRRDQVHLPVVLKAAWGDVAKCGEMWRNVANWEGHIETHRVDPRDALLL